MRRSCNVLLALVLCLGLVTALNGQTTVGIFSKVRLSTCMLLTGSGVPESSITGSICDTYWRTGTAGVYLKESGTASNTGWGQVATLANAVTLTNKTLDAEGTGNVLTVSFTEYWPSAVCDSGGAYIPNWNANGSDYPVASCVFGSNGVLAVSTFPDGATKYIYKDFRLPSDWAGVIDLSIFWRTTATTGNVVWQLQTSCTADGESVDPAVNTVQTTTDATQGVASRFNTATLSTVTTTGCAAGEMLHLRFFRDPTHASDTIAADADFIGIEFKYRRAL